GRDNGALMFVKTNGAPWLKSEQKRCIDAACIAGRISPRITFHGLRHTWASLSIMAGAPLLVVAKNLGHADTRMVERSYGHLSQGFVADAIRAAAPKFGTVAPKRNVVDFAK